MACVVVSEGISKMPPSLPLRITSNHMIRSVSDSVAALADAPQKFHIRLVR